jgi:hypothetical protein
MELHPNLRVPDGRHEAPCGVVCPFNLCGIFIFGDNCSNETTLIHLDLDGEACSKQGAPVLFESGGYSLRRVMKIIEGIAESLRIRLDV